MQKKNIIEKACCYALEKVTFDQHTPRGRFATNAARALAIHGAIVLACYFILFLRIDYGGQILLSLAALCGYIFLGYHLLIPLQSRNLLSVSWFAAPFSLILAAHYFISGDIIAFAVLNYPVGVLAASLSTMLVGGADFFFERLQYIVFLSAFIPSLCMYFGLRLKAWGQSRANGD